MKAVSDILLSTILELQQLPALEKSSLGGGTNLAIRYGHRISYDIDLFFPDIIGKKGYEEIRKQVEAFFKDAIFAMDYPCNLDDQFLFQRFFIRKGEEALKVEIMQNMQTNGEVEIINGIRLMSIQDIGMLKLITVANRANHKDVYDLDYITDEVRLDELMHLLKIKQETYNQPKHQSIFALDDEGTPVDSPILLLKFEQPVKGSSSRPGHSNPRIDFVTGEKSWAVARSSWRRKVRAYFKQTGEEFPGVTPA